eukprot:jgi/Botrbrau1/6702/Bobra.0202s0039.1
MWCRCKVTTNKTSWGIGMDSFYSCVCTTLVCVWGLVMLSSVKAAMQQATPGTGVSGNASWCDGVNGLPGQISVSGTGKVLTAPDTATVSFVVSSTKDTAVAARDDAASVADKVLGALSQVNGITPRDLTTRNIDLSPQTNYSNGQSNITGYTYTLTYGVNVKNATGDFVSGIVDAIVRVGGDAVQLNGIQFSTSDALTAEKQAEARTLAVANAKTIAKQLAEELGVQLGPVLTLSESSGPGPQPRPVALAMQAGIARSAPVSTPVNPDDTAITVSVDVEYRICTRG